MSAAVNIGRISLEAYQQIRFVIGTVTEVQENKKARVPAYLLSLNVGEKLRQEHQDRFKKDAYCSSAQLTENHTLEELQKSQLLCVANFPRKQIGPRKSDCLVTGVQTPNVQGEDPKEIYEKKRLTTVAVGPSEEVSPGSIVGFGGEETVMESNERKLEWSDFTKADLRIGTVKAATLLEVSEKVSRVQLDVDFGGERLVKAVADWSGVPDGIVDRQVLGVVNIEPDDLRQAFGVDHAEAALCSPKDGVWLTPLQAVSNGYKLA